MTPLQTTQKLKNILKDSYIDIDVASLIVSDSMSNSCTVSLILGTGETITGSGVGQVDAAFDALKKSFAHRYKSLQSIDLFGFKIITDPRGLSVTSECKVELQIKNSYGIVHNFFYTSKSVSTCIVKVISEIVEFYVNSEQAHAVLVTAHAEAVGRSRPDLVARYEKELADIVESTSYIK